MNDINVPNYYYFDKKIKTNYSLQTTSRIERLKLIMTFSIDTSLIIHHVLVVIHSKPRSTMLFFSVQPMTKNVQKAYKYKSPNNHVGLSLQHYFSAIRPLSHLGPMWRREHKRCHMFRLRAFRLHVVLQNLPPPFRHRDSRVVSPTHPYSFRLRIHIRFAYAVTLVSPTGELMLTFPDRNFFSTAKTELDHAFFRHGLYNWTYYEYRALH